MTAKQRIYNFILKNQGKESVDSVDISVGTLVRADICIKLLHELQDEGKIIRIEGRVGNYEICCGAKCPKCLKPTLIRVHSGLSKCCNCNYTKKH